MCGEERVFICINGRIDVFTYVGVSVFTCPLI